MTCKHLGFRFTNSVTRHIEHHELPMGDKVLPLAFTVGISVHCTECDEPLRFQAIAGVSADNAQVSLLASADN